MKEILPRIFQCGFPSPSTYEAKAHFVLSDLGNILIEVPRFAPRLITELEFFGGVRYIFVSHRDDVGEVCQFKKHFDARIVMHESESDSVVCRVDVAFEDDYSFDRERTLIHTPGHSPGSSCLLFNSGSGVLFTGDHLLGNDSGLVRPVRFAWTWDWNAQLQSAEKLLTYPFDMVIPAHAVLRKGYIENAKVALRRSLERIRRQRSKASFL